MDLRELINNPETTIVDVRTPFEFMGGSVQGSVNIPLDEVPDRIEEFKAMKGTILLCCATGNRSGYAQSFLNMNGIEDCYNVGSWMDVNYLKSNAA